MENTVAPPPPGGSLPLYQCHNHPSGPPTSLKEEENACPTPSVAPMKPSC